MNKEQKYFYDLLPGDMPNVDAIKISQYMANQSSLKEEIEYNWDDVIKEFQKLPYYEKVKSHEKYDVFVDWLEETYPKPLTPKSIRDSEGWISVKDGLPELNVEVMCYQPPVKFISGGETKGRRLSGYLFELEPDERRGDIDLELLGDRGLSLAAGGKFWAFPYICHQNFVTHWQPLPAPPNEKSASLKSNKLSDSEVVWKDAELSPNVKVTISHLPFPTSIEEYEIIIANLIEAIPSQTNDKDWWPDSLTDAVNEANKLLENKKSRSD